MLLHLLGALPLAFQIWVEADTSLSRPNVSLLGDSPVPQRIVADPSSLPGIFCKIPMMSYQMRASFGKKIWRPDQGEKDGGLNGFRPKSPRVRKPVPEPRVPHDGALDRSTDDPFLLCG